MLHGLPKPAVDLDSRPFWAGCAEHRLLVPRCPQCRTTRWPPGPMCPACQAEGADWIEASGQGTVYSWVIVTHPTDPVLADQVPYVIALIDLPEGIRIIANVVDCAPERVCAGLQVTLVFERQDDLDIPNFRPLPPSTLER